MPPKRLIPAAVTSRINSLGGVMRPVARFVPPLGIVIHRGRKSGKEFRTPVAMFVSNGRVIVPLAHGEGVNWVRNALAASGANVERMGCTSVIINPRVAAAGSGEPLPLPLRLASGSFRFFVADLA